MTAFNPIPPSRASQRLELADIPHAGQLLADFASQGLVRTYARARETIHTAGRPVVVRDAMIPAELWKRIIADSKAASAWATGTVRLDGSPHHGTPTVSLIGIRFNEEDVLAAARQHGSSPVHTAPPVAAVRPRQKRGLRPAPIAADQLPLLSVLAQADPVPTGITPEPPAEPIATPEPVIRQPQRSNAPDPNARWITVSQTIALTSLGRTKVNELMIEGSFKKKKAGRRTLIERASIEQYMAAA